MKMRKSVLALTALILVAVVLIPTYGEVTAIQWIGTANSGPAHDDYYGDGDIVAYVGGNTAILAVTVRHSNATAAGGLNVTRVYVSFDWGQTYASTQASTTSPVIINRFGDTRVFFINFTVPADVSNLYRHSYSVYADYAFLNATGAIKRGTYAPYFANDFVVYSTDQADAVNLKNIYDSYPSVYFSNMSAQAMILVRQAENESSTGDRYYQMGNFAAAKQSYSNAVSDLNLALSDEQAYLTMLQDLQTSKIQADINTENAMTSFLNGLSTMWVLFGIGWVLLSIGYIVKWLRKRPESQPATA
jgi:hypothetical protein